MTNEIFIENKRLDISNDISTLLTLALDDIKDFSSRNTTFSKTIILPGTANNNLLFGQIFNVTVSNPYDSSLDNVSTNFNPSVPADCLIFQNHIQVMKGTMRLLSMAIDKGVPEYEVAVFGELSGLVSKLGSLKLEDLDFSIYDHTFQSSAITGSWDNVSGIGVYYPLIDYGTVSVFPKLDYDVQAFRPALYVKEYIDKIFLAAGYTYTCPLFQTDRFKRLIIPHNSKDFKRPAAYILEVSQGSEHYTNADGTYKVITFTTHTTVSNFTIDAPSELFTYIGADAFSGTLKLLIGGTFTKNSLYPFVVQMLINSSIVATAEIGNGQTSGSYSIQINFDTVLVSGDFIKFFILQPTLSTVWDITMFPGFTAKSVAASLVDITVGAYVTVGDQIPKNITQVDFLASIIKLFNLYVYDDNKYSKKLLIKPYVDFFDANVSGVQDWNYKVDRSRPIILRPMSELNSRFYDFKFKSDNDYYNDLYRKKYNEGYGDLIFDSNYEFINTRTAIEVIFAGTPLVGYAGADKIVPAIYKKNAGVEERIGSVIRILQTKKITGVTSWSIKDGASVLTAGLTAYGYAGHYDDPDAPANDIQFGVPAELYFVLVSGAVNVTQFNVYWSSYMSEITDKDSKMYSAFAKLTPQDIYDIDFSKM